MLVTVDVEVDEMADAIESVQSVLLPWLVEHASESLSEEEAEREYVRLALEVLNQYNPTLDEARQTYFVYRLVSVINELVESPTLLRTVGVLTQEPAEEDKALVRQGYLIDMGRVAVATQRPAPVWNSVAMPGRERDYYVWLQSGGLPNKPAIQIGKSGKSYLTQELTSDEAFMKQLGEVMRRAYVGDDEQLTGRLPDPPTGQPVREQRENPRTVPNRAGQNRTK